MIRLRPFGHGRTRTVRGIGTDTLRVTPRRARCGDCGVTQILLPSTLIVRRADSNLWGFQKSAWARDLRRSRSQHWA